MCIDYFLDLSKDITDEEFERFVLLAKASDGFDIYDRLNMIKADTLVIGSLGDNVLGAEASVELAEKLGCESFMYGKEFGHCVYDEAPDYRQRLIRFFNK